MTKVGSRQSEHGTVAADRATDRVAAAERGRHAGARMSWMDDACQRFNNFDAMRFWLAGIVILSHSYPLLGVPDAQEPLMRATNGQLTFGSFAVSMFFVLSGFLITQSWVKGRGLVDFLRKRVLRIYPGLIVAVLVGALVLAPLMADEPLGMLRSISIGSLVWGCVKLAGYSPPNAFASNPFAGAVNGSLWTIPYEFRCYLMIAALGMAGMFRRRWVVPVLFALTLGFYVWSRTAHSEWNPKRVEQLFGKPEEVARLASAFLAGSVFYLYRMQIPRSGVLALVSAGVLVAAAFVAPAMSVALPIAGTYLFFFLAFEQRLGISGWGRHGDFSYGVYLYGFPVQQTLVAMIGDKIQPLLLFPMALCGATVLAVMSWYLIERPCLQFARGTRPVARDMSAAGAVSVITPVQPVQRG